jgi:uncharacterized repeat protein (TIGR01451 family)
VCRPASGVCDVAESCTGVSATCPANGFLGASTVCRPAADQCDAAENCNGAAASCPADGKKPSGSSCGSSAQSVCDGADTCDGSGTCQSNLAPISKVCRPAASDCDVAENCDGFGHCPGDSVKSDGSPCGSPAETTCDKPDTCLAGSCQDNIICEDCSVTLRKIHNGDTTPGGTVEFTLQWSNSCRDPISNAVISDTLPNGLELVSASSPDASASTAGNTVTFNMGTFAGGDVAQGTITARVADDASPGSTIENVAHYVDDASHSATGSDKLTVRSIDELCPVSLRKVHSGNDNPGGQIQYTLQWSNACQADVTDVTISDPMPDGVLLLSATSSDADVTIDGNSAIFHMASWSAGTVGQGLITATIDPQAPVGESILNVATLSDPAGHHETADSLFRVRGGSTATTSLSCAVSGQVFASPGSFVKYQVRYRNGTENNALSLTLPDEVNIESAFPPPSKQDGQTLEWDNLALTAGKVSVETQVGLLVTDQTVLSTSAFVDDHAGDVAVCEHEGVVSRSQVLFASIKAQTHSRPGLGVRYTARYRDAVGHNQMTVSLPSDVTVLRALPAPSGGTDNTLIFKDLPVPAGVVKIDTQVGNVANGTVLVGSLTMTDETKDIVGAETQTVVGDASSTAGGTSALTLTTVKSVTPGTTTDITIRYDALQPPATITVTLPPELVPTLAVPSGTLTDGQATWSGIATSSGSIKLRVMVGVSAAAGKALVINGSETDGSGASQTAQASTIVRDDTTSSPGLSMTLTLPRTVTAGLTSDFYADWAGLQGTGHLVITLPSGVTAQSTVPSGAAISSSNVTWNGLTDASGTAKVRVLIPASAASGSSLAVSGQIGDTTGASASAAGTTSVR